MKRCNAPAFAPFLVHRPLYQYQPDEPYWYNPNFFFLKNGFGLFFLGKNWAWRHKSGHSGRHQLFSDSYFFTLISGNEATEHLPEEISSDGCSVYVYGAGIAVLCIPLWRSETASLHTIGSAQNNVIWSSATWYVICEQEYAHCRRYETCIGFPQPDVQAAEEHRRSGKMGWHGGGEGKPRGDGPAIQRIV